MLTPHAVLDVPELRHNSYDRAVGKSSLKLTAQKLCSSLTYLAGQSVFHISHAPAHSRCVPVQYVIGNSNTNLMQNVLSEPSYALLNKA
jgi:hypothetical protein